MIDRIPSNCGDDNHEDDDSDFMTERSYPRGVFVVQVQPTESHMTVGNVGFVAAEAFAFGGYTANVTVTPDGTGGPGTQYIWQPDYMQDRYTTDLIDATFSGYCVMTSMTDAFCNFVIVNNVKDQITLAGTLTTPTASTESAGTLAITGGTGAMAGVIGEAEVYANPIGRNVFELATRFDVDVILGVIVCKPQALPVY